MKEKVKLWASFVIVLSIIVIGFFFIENFNKERREKKELGLPPKATNIINHGEGWYSFDLAIEDKVVTIVDRFDDDEVVWDNDSAQPIHPEFLRNNEDDDDDDDDDGDDHHDDDWDDEN